MIYFVGILAFLLGAAAVYFVYGKDLRDEIEDLESEIDIAQEESAQYNAVLGEIESAWYAAFGPAGIHPEQQKESFNKLWRRVGKDEQGMPRG